MSEVGVVDWHGSATESIGDSNPSGRTTSAAAYFSGILGRYATVLVRTSY
jgi:hypothetical protein